MDFVTWWFVEHYVWAFFLTPGCSFLYSLFAGYSFGWDVLIWFYIVIGGVIKILLRANS